ncbi:MAG TPA: hypothetical protein VGD71_08820 [Kribbella sp.]
MDEVQRLLEEFADRAVAEVSPVDVEADVLRGRRALRRMKARRRATGVLFVAALSTAVLVVGNELQWWSAGDAGVATHSADGRANPESTQSEAPARTPAPRAPTRAQSEQTQSIFSGHNVELVANRQSWSGIRCTLVPLGWSRQVPGPTGQVVLTPASVRSSSGPATNLVLQAASAPAKLPAARVIQADGKVFHLGTAADGRAVGQVQLGARWLVVRLPVGDHGWSDEALQRFIASCSLS